MLCYYYYYFLTFYFEWGLTPQTHSTCAIDHNAMRKIILRCSKTDEQPIDLIYGTEVLLQTNQKINGQNELKERKLKCESLYTES